METILKLNHNLFKDQSGQVMKFQFKFQWFHQISLENTVPSSDLFMERTTDLDKKYGVMFLLKKPL